MKFLNVLSWHIEYSKNFKKSVEASIADNESQIDVLLVVDGETWSKLSEFLILVVLITCVFIEISSPFMSQLIVVLF